jgi:hypothetical protein
MARGTSPSSMVLNVAGSSDELEPVEHEREPTLWEASRRSYFARQAGVQPSVRQMPARDEDEH